MNRRRFMSQASLAMMAGLAQPASVFGRQGGARPKVFLFGMAVIQELVLRKPVAHLPPLGKHALFMVAKKAHITGLGRTPVDSDATLLKRIHVDLGSLDSLACVHEEKNYEFKISGEGDTEFSPQARTSLPNLIDLAKEFYPPGNFRFAPPPGTLAIKLSGGELRLPYQPSNSPGTHGFRWRFLDERGERGDTLGLTDLLVFESGGNTLKIESDKGTITLGLNDRLWLVNVPTYIKSDCVKKGEVEECTVDVIDDAHHVFELLTDHDKLPKSISARSFAKFDRPKIEPPFEHPCRDMGPRLGPSREQASRYIPPDTDPCFVSRV